MKTSIPLIETNDAGLISRAYNLGLKLVPNLPHVLTLDDLEFWEAHLGELKLAVERGFKVRNLIDPRFEYIKEFTLTVSMDYVHGTQLATFEKKYRKSLYYFNTDITDANFSRVTNQLVPGKTYTVKIFGIKKTVTSEDCMNLLRSQKAILTGAQGASLAYQEKKDELLRDTWYISFDEKDALWVDALGDHRVPRVERRSDGVCKFRLGYFGFDWDGDLCVLCFCDGE